MTCGSRPEGRDRESVKQELLRFMHLRPTGSSDHGILYGRLRAGFGQYFMGTSPLYCLAKCVHGLGVHPVVIGHSTIMVGYFLSWLKGQPRYDDPEFRRFLRSYQICLPDEGKAGGHRQSRG